MIFLWAIGPQIADMVKQASVKHNVPEELLLAIVRIESGGNAYAVYGGKSSHQCRTKDEAITRINDLHNRNIRNVNIGAMQINLKYHSHQGVDSLLDPKHNIDYGARYLKKLYARFRSWEKAVGYFHAGEKEKFYSQYFNRLNKHLKTPLGGSCPTAVSKSLKK